MKRLVLLLLALTLLAVPAIAQLWNAARSAFAVKIGEAVFDNSGTPWPFFNVINAINYDQGGSGVAYNQIISGNNCLSPVLGTGYRSDAVNFKTSTDGVPFQLGCNLPGTWYKYTIGISQAGPYQINLRVASADISGSPSWTFLLDGTSIGSTAAINTGSYATFQIIQSPQFNATLGNHVLEIRADGGCCAGDVSTVQGAQATVAQTSCNGVSSDPNAAQDGFTRVGVCVDFTQNPLPSNTMDCMSDSTGNNPLNPFLVHVGGLYTSNVDNTGNGSGSGYEGCQYATHEIDPKSGQYALRLRYVCDLNAAHFCGFNPNGQSGIQITLYGWWMNGYLQVTSRIEDTVPGGPLPANLPLVVGGDVNYWGSAQLQNNIPERDYFELWTIEGGNCPSSQNLPNANFGGSYFLFWQPCTGNSPQMPDPRNYFTFAARQTGDGNGTFGYTAWMNGVQTSQSGRTGSVDNEAAYTYLVWLWNAMSACQFGSDAQHPDTPCMNMPINSVSQCSDGNTCISLNTNMNLQHNHGPPWNVMHWIQGGSGISGLQGAHAVDAVGATPTNNFELVDLPWPGGTYGGGAIMNAITERSVWITRVEWDTCPNFDPTFSNGLSGNQSDIHLVPSGNQCNGTVLP